MPPFVKTVEDLYCAMYSLMHKFFFGWDVFVRPVAGRPFTTYRQYLSETDVGNLEIPQHLPNAGQYRLSCFIVFSIY